MWSVTTYWNPLLFTGVWVGAALLMYAAGPDGHPGWRKHLGLALVSVPVWWWFELANDRVDNWEYLLPHPYNAIEYGVFASIAFSTVVPALDAAARLFGVGQSLRVFRVTTAVGTRHLLEAAVGVAATAVLFVFPRIFFPLVWVGPFLLLDAAVGLSGGRSLLTEMANGRWRAPVAVALGGLMCGLLWEFWNFWAAPKWIYHVPYLGYLKVFEMPVLGYLGYVPFAWSIHQLVWLIEDRLRPPMPPSADRHPAATA